MKRLWICAPRFRVRSRVLRLAAAAAAAAAWLTSWGVWAAPAAASTPTVVTIGFDDGTADQFSNGFPILSAHGMHATFSVNTGPIIAADPDHMT